MCEQLRPRMRARYYYIDTISLGRNQEKQRTCRRGTASFPSTLATHYILTRSISHFHPRITVYTAINANFISS